jgi:arylformamidase
MDFAKKDTIYYDISPAISPDFAVFPGDMAFSLTSHCNLRVGDSCTLSSINTTLHVGAHADAPSHYHIEGCDIQNQPLHYYFGNCQVIDLSNVSGVITKQDIEHISIQEPRILFKTNSWLHHGQWQENFTAISHAVIDFLALHGVILIGIDTPSIDLATASNLKTHQTVYKHNMAILECLLLKDIAAGYYSLVALPLPILKGDASPVRAILVPHNTLPNLMKESVCSI